MPILSKKEIQEIIAEIADQDNVIGILLTGSYAYGTPKDTSDIDIRCIINDQNNAAELKRMRFGVPVEVFFNSPEALREYMQISVKEEHGDCVHFWANGKIILDKTGIVKKLQDEAKDLWKKGSPSGKPWNWRSEKHKGGYPKQDWEV